MALLPRMARCCSTDKKEQNLDPYSVTTSTVQDGRLVIVILTMALFIWLTIRLIQLVFSTETVFFSQKNQPTVFFSRLIIPAERLPCPAASHFILTSPTIDQRRHGLR
jgi:hypothetical protein